MLIAAYLVQVLGGCNMDGTKKVKDQSFTFILV